MPSPRRTTILTTLLCTGLLLPAAATSAAKPSSPREREARAQVSLELASTSARARARGAQARCAGADVAPTAANTAAVREAILCLHNEVRAEHGLPQLRENARLRRAALAHSEDMVSRGFFEHTAPGGATMVDRILRARYASRQQGWAFGENLAWGTGRLATPRGAMRAWMNSPGHRENVLRRAYRELGVGVVLGVPTGAREGATYTADFGVRR